MLIPEPFGPNYNIQTETLRKHRSKARKGLASLSRAERQAYGAAVEAAVLAAQRVALRRAGVALPQPNCASGTAHTTGAAIDKAIRERQRNALLAYPSAVRRARSPEQWQAMYEAAMIEKRKRSLKNESPNPARHGGARDFRQTPAGQAGVTREIASRPQVRVVREYV